MNKVFVVIHKCKIKLQCNSEYVNADYYKNIKLTDSVAVRNDGIIYYFSRHPELISANFCTAFMPDSEQIEAIGTKFLCRNSVSVEEI